MYSEISVIVDSLLGNTENGIDPFDPYDGQSAISPFWGFIFVFVLNPHS